MRRFFFLFTVFLLPPAVQARPPRPVPTPWRVFLVDQLPTANLGPALNGLNERRRGPVFDAALQEVVREGKLPPVVVLNRDLSLPATVADEPPAPAGAPVLRIYLTQWSQTPLGGLADTEVLCRLFVEQRRDGKTTGKLGPFLARVRYDTTTATGRADVRSAQFQAAAREAIEQMAAQWEKTPRG